MNYMIVTLTERMDFLRHVKRKYSRKSDNQDAKIKELAKFIQNRYSHQEGLVEVTYQKSKVVVDVDENHDSLGLHIKKVNPELVEVRTSRVNSRRTSLDRSV